MEKVWNSDELLPKKIKVIIYQFTPSAENCNQLSQ